MLPPLSARGGTTPRSTAKWSVSFAEIQKRQKHQAPDPVKRKRWNAGNHDSTSFFERDDKWKAITEGNLATVQLGTRSSPARLTEEKVIMEHNKGTVEIAKELSQFSTKCTFEDDDGTLRPSLSNDASTAPFAFTHLVPPASDRTLRPSSPRSFLRAHTRAILGDVEDQDQEAETQPSALPSALGGEIDDCEAEEFLPVLQTSELPPVQYVSSPPVEMEEACHTPPDLLLKDVDQEEAPPDEEQGEAVKGEGEKEEGENEDEDEDGEGEEEEEEEEESDAETKDDDWPPKPPILKFKAQCQFSTEFKGAERMEAEREKKKAEQEQELMQIASGEKVDYDLTLTWANKYFQLKVVYENQFHAAFPIILLCMLDVVYPKKIQWHRVDWNAGFIHAYHRNHSLLEKIWEELNMYKLRDFRSEHTGLQIEDMVSASTEAKLEFLKHVKRWFDFRVKHSDPYNPILRRSEMERAVRMTGRFMKFPSWMDYDKDAVSAARKKKPDPNRKSQVMAARLNEYEQMPEFKRLIWFLGSEEIQAL